ncbi:ENTH/VHS protein isoform X2 [Wolffia australiana]
MSSQWVDLTLLKNHRRIIVPDSVHIFVIIEILPFTSQVRYLSVLIIDELFMRSKLFRSLIIDRLDNFLSLSIGFRRNMPLPPPTNIAAILRLKGLELLEKWHVSFGIHYRQLRLSLDYLKNTLRYQFPDGLGSAARLQEERRAREIRSREILQKKYDNLLENFSWMKVEIQSTIDQLGVCFGLVYNSKGTEVVSRDFNEDDGEEEFTCPALLRIRQESIKEGEKVHQNDDNASVFDTIRELNKLLLSQHLPSVQESISSLIRVELADNNFRDSALKELIDIRNSINSMKKKCEELGCDIPLSAHEQEEADMWEDGKIESYDQGNAASPVDYQDSQAIVDQASTEDAKSKKFSEGRSDDSESLKSNLLSEAPVLKWGPHLETWGSTQDAMVNYRGLELESHWGRVEHDAVIPRERIAEISAQWSLYQEQQAEIKPCLAPLKNGSLCQRRDLSVCPFHGPIIPRDSNGCPLLIGPEKDKIQKQDDHEKLVRDLAYEAIENVRELDKEKKLLKRAKLARVREHNEAVLRDAALSSRVSVSDFGEAGTSSEGPLMKSKKSSLSSMLKKKVTAKDRLARRLLNSRATDSALKQIMQAEDVNVREAHTNQW